MEDIHKDMLAGHDKDSYGKYKSGLTGKPPGYEDAILKEKEMIGKSMAKHMETTSAQKYVAQANDKLYDLLLHKQPIPAKAWLPSSPEPSSPETPTPIFKDPLPGTVPRRIETFVLPPKKRLQRKTSDDVQASCSMPSDAAPSSLEACAEDAEADLRARECAGGHVEEKFGADEEVSTFMNS